MLMRTLKSSWIMFVTAWALVVASAHAEIGDFDAPTPITSNDLARLMKAAGVQPQEQPQIEAAFDNYVDGWQILRDQTLRLLSVRVAQLRLQQKRPQDDYAAIYKMPPEQQSQYWQSIQAEREAKLKNTAKSEADLCMKVSAACKRIAQLEAPLFEALRAGERSPAQRGAVDRESLHRTRRRLDAVMLVLDNRVPGERICADILSAPNRGLDADAVAKIAAIREAYEQRATPLLEQIAANTPFEPLEEGRPTVVSNEQVEFAQMQMRAIQDIAVAMPKDVSVEWLRKARARAMYAVLSILPMTSRAEVLQAIGERSNPKVVKRLAQWDLDRAALEDQFLATLGTNGLAEAHQIFPGLNTAALEELAQLSDTPDLKSLEHRYWTGELNDPEVPGDCVSRIYIKSQVQLYSKQQARLAERQVTSDGPPQETLLEHLARRVQVRTLNATDVRNIHDRLAITPERRSIWDALAEDLLADTRAYAEQFQQVYDQRDRTPNSPWNTVVIPLTREQRAKQSRREEQWFDDLATTMPELSAQSLAVERARRACVRERSMGGSALHDTQGLGNRWLDIDLDQAIESLKVALPAGAQAAVQEALSAWRAQKLLDLQALVQQNETRLVGGEEEWRKLRNVPYNPENPLIAKLREAQAEQGRNNRAFCRRASEAQQGFIQAIVAVLTPDQARAFQDALYRQMYPEVYRSLERADPEIDRARMGKDASPQQIAAISTLADSFHQRFEPIAERSVKQLDAFETLCQDPGLRKQTFNGHPWNEVWLALEFSEVINDDLQYDRDELVSRTLRQVRSLGVAGSAE
ncbi:MAG: hypothetical protein K8R92_01610 [Planctomycetes bacterium]|nr:hypothetical protein [Planctomycetota bacterium]